MLSMMLMCASQTKSEQLTPMGTPPPQAEGSREKEGVIVKRKIEQLACEGSRSFALADNLSSQTTHPTTPPVEQPRP
jgi:hypothetical protein